MKTLLVTTTQGEKFAWPYNPDFEMLNDVIAEALYVHFELTPHKRHWISNLLLGRVTEWDYGLTLGGYVRYRDNVVMVALV